MRRKFDPDVLPDETILKELAVKSEPESTVNNRPQMVNSVPSAGILPNVDGKLTSTVAFDPTVENISASSGWKHHCKQSETGVGTGDSVGDVIIVRAIILVFDFVKLVPALTGGLHR